jgi:putative SOS response-associated peptidase YedK
MCGRFTQMMSWEEVHRLLSFRLDDGGEARVESDFELRPRWNVAPSTEVAAATLRQDGRGFRVLPMSWGWKADFGDKPFLVNAQSEKYVGPGPSFWKRGWRRALVLASGWYEWQGRGKPFYMRLVDSEVVPLGALFRETPEGPALVILTTPANASLAAVHRRMPLVVAPDAVRTWCDPTQKPEQLSPLAEPYPAALVRFWRVSPRAGDVRNDDSSLVEPLPNGAG